MAITYPHVTIETVEYETLADLAFVDAYLAPDPTAEAYRAGDDDERGRWIVGASRALWGVAWPGTLTDEDQLYPWPRTGVVTAEGPVDPDVIPIPIMQAVGELANAQANGVDISNMTSTAATEKRIKAGSVEIENFRFSDLSASPLPRPAWILIARFLGGGGRLTGGARSRGTCGETVTRPGYGYSGPL